MVLELQSRDRDVIRELVEAAATLLDNTEEDLSTRTEWQALSRALDRYRQQLPGGPQPAVPAFPNKKQEGLKHLSDIQLVVLKAYEAGGPMTDQALQHYLRDQGYTYLPQTVRGARATLRRAQLVFEVGSTTTLTGRRCSIWGVTAHTETPKQYLQPGE